MKKNKGRKRLFVLVLAAVLVGSAFYGIWRVREYQKEQFLKTQALQEQRIKEKAAGRGSKEAPKSKGRG